MRFSSRRALAGAAIALSLAAAVACGQKAGPNNQGQLGPSPGVSLPTLTGDNVLPLTVDGALCASQSYPNKPCVSVTVCAPGGGASSCVTVNDILLDSGSFGFRVFRSALGGNAALNAAFTPPSSGRQLAECVAYGDGSSDWGPVFSGTLTLGGEAPVTVPIQIVDPAFPTANAANSACGMSDPETGDVIPPDQSPASAGFNGILGVGLFAQDCGQPCASTAQNGIYFSCSSTSCMGTTASLAAQVTNPVTALSGDGNGVILELPQVPDGGALFANGYLVLGIGTRANNPPGSGAVALAADTTTGQILTNFAGTQYPSFLDSGSNGIFFPGNFPDCGDGSAGWFCPAQLSSLSATNLGAAGSPSSVVSFAIGPLSTFAATGNGVSPAIGGDGAMGGAGTELVDWGMPFFFGRNTYVEFENAASSLGSGPLWAY